MQKLIEIDPSFVIELNRVKKIRSGNAVVVMLLEDVLHQPLVLSAWQSAIQAHTHQDYGLAWTWMYVHHVLEGSVETYKDLLERRVDETYRIWWFSSSAGRWNQTPNKKSCDRSRKPCAKCQEQGFHAIKYRLRRSAPFTKFGKKKTQQKWLPRQLSEDELLYINTYGWMMDADIDGLVEVVTDQHSQDTTAFLKHLYTLPPTKAVGRAKQIVSCVELPQADHIRWKNECVEFDWLIDSGVATMQITSDSLHLSTHLAVESAQQVVSDLKRLGRTSLDLVQSELDAQISTIEATIAVTSDDPVKLHHLKIEKLLLETLR